MPILKGFIFKNSDNNKRLIFSRNKEDQILKQLMFEFKLFDIFIDLGTLKNRYNQENRSLDLSNLNLPVFPGNLADLDLKELDISHNQITVIPDTNNLIYLERLIVQGNPLHSSPDLSQFIKLKYMDLSNCGLYAIDDSISLLQKLEYLDLSNNHIQLLPTDFNKLENLNDLSLQNNELAGFSEDLVYLIKNFKLRNLKFDWHRLAVFVPEISMLNPIINLDLSNSNLFDLPRGIHYFNRLEWINLENNNLSIFPRQLLGIGNLVGINLANNKITELPATEIHNSKAKNLRWLDLSGNPVPRDFEYITRSYFVYKGHGHLSLSTSNRFLVLLRKNILSPDQRIVKISMIGQVGSGVSSILSNLIDDKFTAKSSRSLRTNLSVYRTQYFDTSVILQFWELVGDSHYALVRQLYYNGTQILIVVFDLTDPQSLSFVPQFIAEALENSSDTSSSLNVLVIGNKQDLSINRIPEEQVLHSIRSLRNTYPNIISYIPYSAKTMEKMHNLHEELAKLTALYILRNL